MYPGQAGVGSRTSLVLLGLIFLAPVVAAWWLYHEDESWRPAGTTNHGILITPVRPLERRTGWRTPDGETLAPDYLRGKWTLVYIGTGECPAACAESLYRMRQARLSQGENMNRVQRLYLIINDRTPTPLPAALGAYAGMDIAVLSPREGLVFLKRFRIGAESVQEAHNIYLVDPLGNLMMYFPPETDPGGMLKDLRRLLKHSQIG
jgi:cytochrome oxidase Cu insertion factor (SCO1/SenC/PrrC family)